MDTLDRHGDTSPMSNTQGQDNTSDVDKQLSFVMDRYSNTPLDNTTQEVSSEIHLESSSVPDGYTQKESSSDIDVEHNSQGSLHNTQEVTSSDKHVEHNSHSSLHKTQEESSSDIDVEYYSDSDSCSDSHNQLHNAEEEKSLDTDIESSSSLTTTEGYSESSCDSFSQGTNFESSQSRLVEIYEEENDPPEAPRKKIKKSDSIPDESDLPSGDETFFTIFRNSRNSSTRMSVRSCSNEVNNLEIVPDNSYGWQCSICRAFAQDEEFLQNEYKSAHCDRRIYTDRSNTQWFRCKKCSKPLHLTCYLKKLKELPANSNLSFCQY